jgi:D-alanine-D-alanine ligase
MAKKLRVGILFGGRSGEHEVSLLSAASILKAIDRKKFDVVPLGITKQGRWVTGTNADRLLAGKPLTGTSRSLLPSPDALAVDVIFPVLHGTFGEDGTVQGLLELAGVPYVGSGVLGSSAGMDKAIMKSLFKDAGLPIVADVVVSRAAIEKDAKSVTQLVERRLRYPVFAKPANLGSSVGISKVHNRAELLPALRLAAQYDHKIIVEQGASAQGVKARELEVAVLGNHDAKASVVGEIIPGKEFYDYEAKYLSDGSVPVIPARVPKTLSEKVRKFALMAFQACDLSGLARVDFLLDPATGDLFLNEVNTLPGFTSISMYPKLWEASGLAYKDLITRLIELALERAAERASLSYSRE